MKRVVKRKGYEEEFDPEKIKASLEKAARDAKVNNIFQIVEDVSRIVFEFCEDKNLIATEDIRNLILDYLKEKYPPVYEAWLNYEKEVKVS